MERIRERSHRERAAAAYFFELTRGGVFLVATVRGILGAGLALEADLLIAFGGWFPLAGGVPAWAGDGGPPIGTCGGVMGAFLSLSGAVI